MINKKKIENIIYELIEAIGEDPKREGLRETPKRVAEMYGEIFSGTEKFPLERVKTFKETPQEGEIILVRDIPFYSMCEHHILPFFGVAHVAYIPKYEIIGLSKIARIVSYYAKRLQIQERMTRQIADFLFNEMKVLGSGVVVEAEHMCMTMRGIKAAGSKTKTCIMRGLFQSNIQKKEEFYSLL